jgi:tRNA (cmo5U34)-methyltransferase
METQTSNREELGPGHHWKEADRAQDYVARNEDDAGPMAEVFGLLTAILPYDAQAPLRVLDIGSGHGVVAAAILDAFPNSVAVGLDISEAMMELGRQRMAHFGDRFSYHLGDFGDGTLPADLIGPFDLTVSCRAIHHIIPEAKQRLYADVLGHTAAGGSFFNVDNMSPRDDFVRARYRQVPDPTSAAAGRAPRPPGARTGGSREHPDPVSEQLAWLWAAGWAHVDCYWKRLGRSMIGGFKPE